MLRDPFVVFVPRGDGLSKESVEVSFATGLLSEPSGNIFVSRL